MFADFSTVRSDRFDALNANEMMAVGVGNVWLRWQHATNREAVYDHCVEMGGVCWSWYIAASGPVVFPEPAPVEPAKPAPVPEPVFWAVYLVALAYGGPEEGGWWYEEGNIQTHADLHAEGYPIDAPSPFGVAMVVPTRDDEEPRDNGFYAAHIKPLQDLLDLHLNNNRPRLSDSNSRGVFRVCHFDNHIPHHWPATRPHYE